MTDVKSTSTPIESRVVRADVTTEAIDAQTLLREVISSSDGAVVTFEGIIRDHDHGRTVHTLRYSAHPTAAEVIKQVAMDTALEHPGVTFSVVHRIGDLTIGECALACVVTSAHRAEAFQVCATLVDRVKEKVPIWKEQEFSDGATEWVNAIS